MNFVKLILSPILCLESTNAEHLISFCLLSVLSVLSSFFFFSFYEMYKYKEILNVSLAHFRNEIHRIFSVRNVHSEQKRFDIQPGTTIV